MFFIAGVAPAQSQSSGIAPAATVQDATFLRSLASAAGVTPEVRASGTGTSKLEVRRPTSDTEQFVFVFNHAAGPADATIRIRMPWRVQHARDLVSGETLASPALQNATRGDDTILQKNLAANGVWIVRLERQ